ncbi:MAG: tetratricopeptide repeat protein [Vicinamibacterales bacterium]|nr:tetratricopeptide repeat protein [Vicinamibacterales bacterium]
MPIDREQTLKRAEKLLRQGRLEAAIAEYGQVVSQFPRDWATANLLGDLYVRAGEVGSASQQYARIADHLAHEGFTAKAAALYKKILKLSPGDETALMRSAELAAAQGMTADVRTFMTALGQLALRRGDREGAILLARKRVSFDPADVVGRLDAARMLAEAGDQSGAAAELRVAAASLESQGRLPDALRALREAARLTPDDDESQSAILRLLLQQGDLAAAADLAQSPRHLRVLLAECRSRGLDEAARSALVRLASLEPDAVDVRLDLARRSLAAGELQDAVTWAAVDRVTEAPELAVVLAHAYLRLGRVDEGQTLLAEAVSRDPGRLDDVAGLVQDLILVDRGAAAAALLVVADAYLDRGDAAAANRCVGAFLDEAADDVALLRRQIEICVDGGFEQDLRLAQLRLADALIGQGEWQEARFIAEDLVAAWPEDARFRQRLRRVNLELGIGPDREADRLPSTEQTDADDLALLLGDGARDSSPAVPELALSDDFADLVAALSAEPADDVPHRPARETPDGGGARDTSEASTAPWSGDGAAFPVPPARRVTPRGSDLIVFDDNLRRLFEDGAPPAASRSEDGAFEVDLSGLLQDIRVVGGEAAPTPASQTPSTETTSLDGYFRELRDQASGAEAETDRLLAQGEAEAAAGRPDEAIALWRAAAREPRVRRQASRAIARVARARGNLAEAVEWLERAAETPPDTPDGAQELLYELAETLVHADEDARALAVFMELQATHPDYKDVAQRILALSNRRAGWAGGGPGGTA